MLSLFIAVACSQKNLSLLFSHLPNFGAGKILWCDYSEWSPCAHCAAAAAAHLFTLSFTCLWHYLKMKHALFLHISVLSLIVMLVFFKTAVSEKVDKNVKDISVTFTWRDILTKTGHFFS